MRKQWTYVVVIVLGLVLGAWAVVHYGRRSLPVEVGSQAPDFSAVNLRTGDTVSLAKTYRGQVVLVNLWGTFCVPCRVEMPAMEKLYRELGPKGFKIAAVSVDQGSTKDVLEFARGLDLTFDILHDGDGSVQQAFQTVMFPESFLIDRSGVVVKKVIGEHPWGSDANRQVVATLLGVTLEPRPAADSTTARPEKPKPGG